MSALRNVDIVVSSQKTADVYYAKSYPDEDFDNDGRRERYKTPVYKVFLKSRNAAGGSIQKDWRALRFMPFWNDPGQLSKKYSSSGWLNSGLSHVARMPVPAYLKDYEIHNTVSRFNGAIQIKGNFLVHGGPESTISDGWGAAGCIEIIGNFDEFRTSILQMAGSTQTDIHAGMQQLVSAKLLYIQVDMDVAPDLKAARDGNFKD